MLLPLVPLALGAIVAGYFFFPYFVDGKMVQFWQTSLLVLPDHNSLARAEALPRWVGLAPLVVGLAGIAVAFVFYILAPNLPARLATTFRPLYLFLLNKWYFDEVYDWLFVRPAKLLGYGLWKGGDGAVIDGLGPDGIATVTRDLARRAGRLQTGYVYHYAFAMLIGVVLLVSWYLWRMR